MLEHLISKYTDRRRDKKEVVYKLTYSGKFIIVKGKTLCGSLTIISNTFKQYKEDNKRFRGHLYRHLYDHFKANDCGRFRFKTLARVNSKTDQYKLLKREQMELDKNRHNPKCLNNATEVYIPLYDEITDMYGWLNRSAVMNFKKWLDSKERKAYIKRYSKKPKRVPAKSGL
jgi:hypothetical protein